MFVVLFLFGKDIYGGVPWLFPFLIMMKQVKFYCHRNIPHFVHNLFFSELPAPVPLYFDGVTLKR